jgi:hypothetical protein
MMLDGSVIQFGLVLKLMNFIDRQMIKTSNEQDKSFAIGYRTALQDIKKIIEENQK